MALTMRLFSDHSVLRKWLAPLAAPVAAIVVALAGQAGAVSQATAYNLGLCAVYGMVVLAMSLLASWAGVWSIGHPAMLAIGCYVAAYGSTHGWPLEVTVAVAALLPAACGALLGFAGARFSVLYIALLTMAFDLAVLEIIGRWTSVTGGDQGVPVGNLTSMLGLGSVGAAVGAVPVAIITFGLVLGLAVAARRSSLRLRQVAAKSHAPASLSIGIAPELQTALAFAISAAVTGVAGVLLASMTGFVSPEPFSLGLATSLIAATVLGGVGSIGGAIVGGAFLTYVGTMASGIGLSQPVLEGAVLIAILLLLPRGVIPSAGRLTRMLTRRLHPVTGTPAAGSGGAPHPAKAGPGDPAGDVTASAASERDRAEREASGSAEPVVRVAELNVRFGGLKALTGVSFEIRRGEVLGIIGPNGAGKTTLINVLSGLRTGGKVAGRISYRGGDLLGVRAVRRRRLGIARTFQHAEVFGELTVLENVLCTRRAATARARREALAVLAEVGLADVADRMPHELPFGLQKRVDLARAVAAPPELLIMDEPFGGLDSHEREVTAALIHRLRRAGTTIMIVDHVIADLFALADRVVAFDFGTPIGSGPPDEVLADPRVRSSYLGVSQLLSAAAVPAPPPSPAPGAPLALRLRGVAHHYDGVAALRGIDLDIPAGSLFGIVGANGAGKSTIGRVAAGALKPSAGTRELLADGSASLVPEGRELFKRLSVRENLEVAGYGAGLRGRELRRRIDESLDWLPSQVRDRLSVHAGSLSGGEQQLVAITRGLVGRPSVLILDEPALGLAPAMVEEVYGKVRSLADGGMTVILLEQLLARALTACPQLAILRDGEVVAAGSPADPGFAAAAELAYFGERSEDLGAPAA